MVSPSFPNKNANIKSSKYTKVHFIAGNISVHMNKFVWRPTLAKKAGKTSLTSTLSRRNFSVYLAMKNGTIKNQEFEGNNFRNVKKLTETPHPDD